MSRDGFIVIDPIINNKIWGWRENQPLMGEKGPGLWHVVAAPGCLAGASGAGALPSCSGIASPWAAAGRSSSGRGVAKISCVVLLKQ